MTRTERADMLNNVISDRIKLVAYRAWFKLYCTPKLTGTVYSKREKR